MKKMILKLLAALALLPMPGSAEPEFSTLEKDLAGTSEKLSKWSCAQNAEFLPDARGNGQNVIRVVNPEASKSRQLWFPLAIEQVRGRTIELAAEIKAEKVQRPDKPYKGIKLMLVIKDNDGTVRYNDMEKDKYGSYDWRKCKIRAMIPDNAQKVEICVGLQEAAGCVYFSRINVAVLQNYEKYHFRNAGSDYTATMLSIKGDSLPFLFHKTPMDRRLVLHPQHGECDFSRYGYLELGFQVKSANAIPVRITVRDNTRRINEPEICVKKILNPQGGSPIPFRIHFAGNADFGYVINPSRIARILIETDTPEQFRHLELTYAKLGGNSGDLPPGVRFNIVPEDGMLYPSRRPLDFPGKVKSATRNGALELDFHKDSGLFLLKPKGCRWDLSAYDRVHFLLHNPGVNPVNVTCFVSGAQTCTKQNSVYEEIVVPPYSRATVEVNFRGRSPWICRLASTDTRAKGSDAENERAKVAESFGGSPLWNEDVLTLAIAADKPLVLEKAQAVSGIVTMPEWSGKRPPVPGNWKQTLNEEFHENRINPELWTSGWSWTVTNPKLLCNYSPRNLLVKDGMLHIRAEKKISYFDDNIPDERYFREYTSGSMTSFDKFSQRYGYFEARLRPVTLHGLWPAFWAMPDHGRGSANRRRTILGGTEIDIFEQPGRFGPHRNNIACHWWATSAMKEHKMMGFNRLYAARDKNGFITCGILWEPGKLTWYLNGEPVAIWDSPSVPSVPVYLKLCVQIGGWGGYLVEHGKLPYDFLVDYVKVWQRDDWEALNRREKILELHPEL